MFHLQSNVIFFRCRIGSASLPSNNVCRCFNNVFFINRLSPHVYDSDHYTLFKVTLDHDGKVCWEPGGHFISKCQVDVRFYPFDSQTCYLEFMNWVHTGDLVNLTIAEDANRTMLEYYTGGGEWELSGLATSSGKKSTSTVVPNSIPPYAIRYEICMEV